MHIKEKYMKYIRIHFYIYIYIYRYSFFFCLHILLILRFILQSLGEFLTSMLAPTGVHILYTSKYDGALEGVTAGPSKVKAFILRKSLQVWPVKPQTWIHSSPLPSSLSPHCWEHWPQILTVPEWRRRLRKILIRFRFWHKPRPGSRKTAERRV